MMSLSFHYLIPFLLIIYRPTCSNIAKVHIWHGGVFVRNPIIGYSNGECVIESRWDIDEINSIEVAKKVKLLGYLAFNVWYKHPSLEIAKPFKDDGDVLVFMKDVVGQNEVHFYVEYLEDSEPEVVIEGEVFKPNKVVCEGGKDCVLVVEGEGLKEADVVGGGVKESVVVGEGVHGSRVAGEGLGCTDGVNETDVVGEGVNTDGVNESGVVGEGVNDCGVVPEVVNESGLVGEGVNETVNGLVGGEENSTDYDDSDYDSYVSIEDSDIVSLDIVTVMRIGSGLLF